MYHGKKMFTEEQLEKIRSGEDYDHEEFAEDDYFTEEYLSENETNAQYFTGDGSYDGGNYYYENY